MLAAIRSFRRSLAMLRAVRAGLGAALLTIAFASVAASANAAEKPFKQSALDEAAIKLEAQIKSDAGTVAKPAAAFVATPTRHSRRMTSGRAWWSSVSLS